MQNNLSHSENTMSKDYLDVWGTNTTKSYMLTYAYFISKSTKQRNVMIQENTVYLKDAGSFYNIR